MPKAVETTNPPISHASPPPSVVSISCKDNFFVTIIQNFKVNNKIDVTTKILNANYPSKIIKLKFRERSKIAPERAVFLTRFGK